MQLAADIGVTEKKTKLSGKVRTFLDQKVRLDQTSALLVISPTAELAQAIHFYGANPSKSRTKRTRY